MFLHIRGGCSLTVLLFFLMLVGTCCFILSAIPYIPSFLLQQPFANSSIVVFIMFPSPLLPQLFHTYISPISSLMSPASIYALSIVLPCPYKSYLLPYMSSIYLFTCVLSNAHIYWCLPWFPPIIADDDSGQSQNILYRIWNVMNQICVAYLEFLQ